MSNVIVYFIKVISCSLVDDTRKTVKLVGCRKVSRVFYNPDKNFIEFCNKKGINHDFFIAI